jgi:ABC-type antimicrobial peptide transport system permease subunit
MRYGAIGILLGIGGAILIAELAEWRTELSDSSIVLAASFAATVGIFFGYYPLHEKPRACCPSKPCATSKA